MGASARLAALVAILLVAACGGGEERGGGAETGGTQAAEPSSAPTGTGPAATDTAAEDAGRNRCENPVAGYALEYPADWHVNSGDVSQPCSFFDPRPVEVPEATDAIQFAVAVSREPASFDVVTGESPAQTVLEQSELTIAGRPAVSLEFEATGQGLLESGTRGYQYAVDVDGETLVATTYDLAGFDYERNKEVLDLMAGSLELTG